MYTKQAEFKAGLVVLLAIAGLLALVWFAAGAESIFGEWRFIHIRFEQGFVAPKKGDAVQMLGAEVGRVESITMQEEVRGTGGTKPLTDLDRLKLGLGPDDEGTYRELYILAVVKMKAEQVVPVGTRAQIEESSLVVEERWGVALQGETESGEQGGYQ